MQNLLIATVIALSIGMVIVDRQAMAEPVDLVAADGTTIYGEVWSAGKGAPILLAFHQASSSHGEYAPLADRFVAAGFTVLAIDQRSGGNLFGTNATVELRGASSTYESALMDLEAALSWAKTTDGSVPIVVMGSSYSASLVFLLAAAHPGEIAGLAAFSPGEYLSDDHAVRRAAAKVNVPIFITQGDGEEADAGVILASAASSAKTQFVPKSGGVHGASTLRTDKNPRGAAENLQAFLSFLSQFRRP